MVFVLLLVLLLFIMFVGLARGSGEVGDPRGKDRFAEALPRRARFRRT